MKRRSSLRRKATRAVFAVVLIFGILTVLVLALKQSPHADELSNTVSNSVAFLACAQYDDQCTATTVFDTPTIGVGPVTVNTTIISPTISPTDTPAPTDTPVPVDGTTPAPTAVATAAPTATPAPSTQTSQTGTKTSQTTTVKTTSAKPSTSSTPRPTPKPTSKVVASTTGGASTVSPTPTDTPVASDSPTPLLSPSPIIPSQLITETPATTPAWSSDTALLAGLGLIGVSVLALAWTYIYSNNGSENA